MKRSSFGWLRSPVLFLSLILAGLAAAPAAFAALGDADPTFNPGGLHPRIARISTIGKFDEAYPAGTGFNGSVNALARQTDGKMVVGGSFTSFNGATRRYIARLNADGTLDQTFNPVVGFNGPVTALAADGDKVVAGGMFTSFDGVSRNYIARLNADGTLDASFDPGTGFNFHVYALAMQGSNVVVGGQFTAFDGSMRNRIARLKSDGSLDGKFDPRLGFEGGGFATIVTSLALDGSDIIAGGIFDTYNGVLRKNIARILEDGSISTSFNPGSGFSGPVFAVVMDGPDIVAGGDFFFYNGTLRRRVARLKGDGTLDAGFEAHIGGGDVWSLAADGGKVIVGGSFTEVGASRLTGIARLDPDGSQDMSFDVGAGVDSFVYAVAFDGTDVVIGGSFITDLNSGFDRTVFAMDAQEDGKIIVGGAFGSYDGVPRNRIARINADGTLDNTFDPGSGFNGAVYAVQVDGTDIIVAGGFTEYDGTPRHGIARLHGDGSLDASFDPHAGFDATVTAVALSGDQVYAGGWFASFDGHPARGIVRLKGDGSFDPSFNSGMGFDTHVYALSMAGTDIMVGGDFMSFNGVARNSIARLNPDGTLDAGFNPGMGFDGTVYALAADGTDIYVGGRFDAFNGVPSSDIARLNADGSLDADFSVGTGFSNWQAVRALVMDGSSVFAAGSFVSYQGAQALRLARIDKKGNLDAAIDTANGFDNDVYALAMSGSDLIVGGDFYSYESQGFIRLAKIDATDPAGVTLAETGNGTVVAENGAMDTLTVVLNERPSANVTVGLKSENPSQAFMAPQALVFTPADWSVPRTVTVHAVDDPDMDGTQIVALQAIVDSALSAAEYQGVVSQGVAATVEDNDHLPATIRLFSPNGGETLSVGSQYFVTWQQAGDPNHSIRLSLSTDGGMTYAPIVALPAPDPGFYQWTVPASPTNAAKVRAEFIQNGVPVIFDDSDAVFAIVPTATTTPPPPGGATIPPPLPKADFPSPGSVKFRP